MRPIVGVLDSSRASEMTSALLEAVVEEGQSDDHRHHRNRGDGHARTDHFLRMARAVKLLGADCALSGINPNVARTICTWASTSPASVVPHAARGAARHVKSRARRKPVVAPPRKEPTPP